MGGLPILHTVARGIPVWMQMMLAEKIYGKVLVEIHPSGEIGRAHV